MNVAEMVGPFDRVESDGVGGAGDRAPFDAAAGHPHREAEVVVIAALSRLCLGGSAELTAPDHEGCVEQAPALQVGEQGGDGPVGLGGLVEMVPLNVGVCVPLTVRPAAARDDANETGRRSRRASA